MNVRQRNMEALIKAMRPGQEYTKPQLVQGMQKITKFKLNTCIDYIDDMIRLNYFTKTHSGYKKK